MTRPRVLVTGPTHALREYADAARAAGWEAVERALVAITPREIDWAPDFEGLPDVTLVTSQSALASLVTLSGGVPGLRDVPVSVVGQRTADEVARLGFRVRGRAADSATSLASRFVGENASRVLWLRGSVSDRLAVELREHGHAVWDPIAYETAGTGDRSPLVDTHAVFFASPSAVRAWRELARARRREHTIAIAIGTTTAEEIEQAKGERFFDILVLPHPAPDALTWRLENLGYEPPA